MENIHPIFDQLLGREEKQTFLKQKSKVLWFTGLSGSGKSTISQNLEKLLFARGYFVQALDGDNMRTGVCNNLTFSLEDRIENIRRIAEVSKLFKDAGVVTLNSFVSPTIDIRNQAKQIIGEDDFLEIYVKASVDVCETRDVKGLYKKARNGEIKNFTGIDSPYEAPVNPALVVDTSNQTVEESVETVFKFLEPFIKA